MSKKARRAGVDIAYEVVGEGTPLVLLHLIFDTREFWWRSGYVDSFRSAGRQLVLIDASGHGESSKPHDKEAYSLHDALTKLSQCLMISRSKRRRCLAIRWVDGPPSG